VANNDIPREIVDVLHCTRCSSSRWWHRVPPLWVGDVTHLPVGEVLVVGQCPGFVDHDLFRQWHTPSQLWETCMAQLVQGVFYNRVTTLAPSLRHAVFVNASNCRRDGSAPKTMVRNCRSHLQQIVRAVSPSAIVAFGEVARVAVQRVDWMRVPTYVSSHPSNLFRFHHQQVVEEQVRLREFLSGIDDGGDI